VPFLEKLLRSKLFVWTLLVLPGLWPLWQIFAAKNASVLADPLKYVLHHLGFTACVLLATVLTFTPLRALWPKWGVALALNRQRRLVGVASFVYAALHFVSHLLYEGGLDPSFLPEILRNSVKKPFQLVGMIALAILLVLAITSLNAFVRWLGGKAWKNLHRFVYVAAFLAAYHQAIARKVFPLQVVWIFGPLAVLEIARVWKQRSAATASRAAQSG
jgi:sulfoxide reductase heme-binding subunit YedZ